MSTSRNSAWSEAQIQSTIKAYFSLLKRQSKGEKANKKAIYESLAVQFPERNYKAFEAKFQNISAILYEQHLDYCAGLKPRFNYQNLLKLMVLDYLKRNPQPIEAPHEILFRKLNDLKQRGELSVVGQGTGRYGLTLEHHLGIPQNSDKQADFMGIELKTKRQTSNTLQTLFSRTPTRYKAVADKTALVMQHGYWDAQRARQALYTSFNSRGDTLGFLLKPGSEKTEVWHHQENLFEYDAEKLEEALLVKHSQTAYIQLSAKRVSGEEKCYLESMLYCKWPSILRFIKLMQQGDIYLDLTLSHKNGRTKDHGFLWRIMSESIPLLYLSSEVRVFN